MSSEELANYKNTRSSVHKLNESISALETSLYETRGAFEQTTSAPTQEDYSEDLGQIQLTKDDANGLTDKNEEITEWSSDSESGSDSNFSGSEFSEGIEDSDSDIESPPSAEEKRNDCSRESFPVQESACMAILTLIARHCITAEAAKDIIDLLKILSPENDLLQSLRYANVQQVCGNCELCIYDICEKCLALFPKDREDEVTCSTSGCNG